jgi:hypothetical protein
MFVNRDSPQKQRTLLTKKHLFQQQIRSLQRGRIISDLREQAQMPPEIFECLNDLPHSLDELIRVVTDCPRLPPSWYKAIGKALLALL